jgi:DnaJ like chaperone protein
MDQYQKKFLASLAALLAKMAMADGVVTPSEIRKVASIWGKLGLTPEQSEYCDLSFEVAKRDGISFDRYVQEFVATRFGVDAREFLYSLLWDVSCSDGVLHRNEKKILNELPGRLGLPPDSYYIYYRRQIEQLKQAFDEEIEAREKESRQKAEDARRRKAQEEAGRRAFRETSSRREKRGYDISVPRDIQSAYGLFGCAPSASVEDLRRIYRQAAMRWHPDRLRTEGVPQELIDTANLKMAAYNAAWSIIKRQRRIK